MAKLKLPVLAVCGILVSVIAIIATTWGFDYNWPDFVHTNYGFPFIWGTHTLITFAGPVDKWNIDVSMLALDLTVWLGAVVATVVVIAGYIRTGEL